MHSRRSILVAAVAASFGATHRRPCKSGTAMHEWRLASASPPFGVANTRHVLARVCFAVAQSIALGGLRRENGARIAVRGNRRACMSGLDKTIETALVNTSPQWLTDVMTRF